MIKNPPHHISGQQLANDCGFMILIASMNALAAPGLRRND